MSRGRNANVGDTRVAQNGYHYTKTKRGWKLTHHLIAEEALGRRMKDNERTKFIDGDRTNLSPDNIQVFETKNSKEDKKKAIKQRIKVLQQQLRDLEDED